MNKGRERERGRSGEVGEIPDSSRNWTSKKGIMRFHVA
jgi:hypothetical protein